MKPITIAAGAQLTMLSEMRKHPGIEHVFAVAFDHRTREMTSARFLLRGRPDTAMVPTALLDVGEFMVHNHPNAKGLRELLPSDADLQLATKLANCGVGSALVTDDLDHVFVIAEPLQAAVALPTVNEANRGEWPARPAAPVARSTPAPLATIYGPKANSTQRAPHGPRVVPMHSPNWSGVDIWSLSLGGQIQC